MLSDIECKCLKDSDNDGLQNASVGVEEHGGLVEVWSKDEKPKAALGVDGYGNGAISTWDKNGDRQ